MSEREAPPGLPGACGPGDRDEPIVAFQDVSVEIDRRPVLEGITFDVARGHFLGIVGPNGAGKTTLLKALLGLVPVGRGEILVFGRPVGRRDRETHAIGYVPQRQAVAPTFPATVADTVLLGRLCCLGPWRFPRSRDWQEVERTLERVGLAHLRARPVGALSGGEQRRVLLAQALCASTRLLVLDEPTIGLDLPAEQEFYGLLRELQQDLGLTILAVSHDLVALASGADELLCINRRMHIHANPVDVVRSRAMREAYACEFGFLEGELEAHARRWAPGEGPRAPGAGGRSAGGPGPDDPAGP